MTPDEMIDALNAEIRDSYDVITDYSLHPERYPNMDLKALQEHVAKLEKTRRLLLREPNPLRRLVLHVRKFLGT